MNINDLYNALAKAETGAYSNPWIRTRVRGSDSSAFGPVQLTGGSGSMMANIARGNANIGATDEELDWIKNTFLPQGSNFLKYGGDDMVPGYERYDYGGTGDFTDTDKVMYENISKKIMESEYKRLGGDLDLFIDEWRGADDPEYKELIKDQLLQSNVLKEQGSDAFKI